MADTGRTVFTVQLPRHLAERVELVAALYGAPVGSLLRWWVEQGVSRAIDVEPDTAAAIECCVEDRE